MFLTSRKFLLICLSVLLGVLLSVFSFKKTFPFIYYKNAMDGVTLKPPNREVPLPASSSILHDFRNAAVCSDSDVCSKVGRDILQRGGNVMDSALATLFCNGLITMQSMGIGGGFVMNVYIRAERRAFSIIAREAAPLASSQDMFEAKGGQPLSENPLIIAVPGEVKGYGIAFRRFASLKWNELLQPTIEICDRGFPLSMHQRDSLDTNSRQIKRDPRLRRTFVNEENGKFHRIGTHIFPPKKLCETYRALAERGAEDFYNGTLAELIAKDLRDIGSVITLKDLKKYHVEVVPSEAIILGENILHLTPPVGSGHIVGFIMNILLGFREAFLSAKNLGVKAIHRIIEALKFGFVQRWQLDDDCSEELLQNLTNPDYAAQLRTHIDDNQTYSDPEHYGATHQLVARPEHGTAQISILAPNGDAISVTSSINFYFGSGRTGVRTGIIFNNAMADFSIEGIQNYFYLPATKKNRIRPGGRAMSSMAPTIVTTQEGDVRLVVGAAGGTKIISALVHLLVRILWLGNDIKQAIDAARFHHQMLPNVFEYEYGVLQNTIDKLELKGHSTSRYRERGTAICGIARNATAVYANADFRKEGSVSGF